MDREPKSVVELWVIGIIITIVLGFVNIILGVVSGSLFGIAILVRIDNNNKLLRRQIKAQNN